MGDMADSITDYFGEDPDMGDDYLPGNDYDNPFIWVTKIGDCIQICDLPTEHLTNIIALLKRKDLWDVVTYQQHSVLHAELKRRS